MSTKFRFLVLSLAFVVTANLTAGPIEDVFESAYIESYRPRFCGENILNFVRQLSAQGIDVSDLHIVSITNTGFSVFGMVNAQQARSLRSPAEANWYHHVIAVDSQGNVYDFDYRNEPTIVSFADYAEDMFLDEPECGNKSLGGFCGGRENKLNQYQLEWTNAAKALSASDPKPDFTKTLKQSLTGT